ncbi:hypothetical protein FSP39_024748 [Pinctada imbricata]|nr:hypothetical protein FSP39_024748 [Pinctada imbricata]
MQKYILESETPLFALFCQRDCRYCQPVKELFHGMSQDFTNCVFLIVDANMPTLPRHLQVPYTPLVRFRGKTPDSWVNFDGKKYDILSLTSFLSMQLRGLQTDDDPGEEQLSTEEVISSRSKRSLGDGFIKKHISTFKDMGGATPRSANVDKVSFDVMTNLRKPLMKRKKWKGYDDIDYFVQTYIVANSSDTLKMSIDMAVQDAISYTIAYHAQEDAKTKQQKDSCNAPSNQQNLTDTPKCIKENPKLNYYKCNFNLTDLSSDADIYLVNMAWSNKTKTCMYSTGGRVTLGAGKKKNAHDYEINHLEKTYLDGEMNCQ